jgi:nucleotide-binding universal stress UspA family protein
MRTILVPVDFSENSQSAMNAAKMIAGRVGAKLYLLHVYVPFVPTEIHVPISAEIYSGAESSSKERLELLRTEFASEGLAVESLWREGAVVGAVLEEAARLSADLVVLGRTGEGGFLDKLFGSVATDIVKNLEKIPVLTIPPKAVLTTIDHIVYATRLEHDEIEAIRSVAAFAKLMDAKLTFLKLDSQTQTDIQPDHQFIQPIQSELGFTDSDFVTVDIGRNSPVDEIERQAKLLGADILVVSAKEKGFLEELLVDPSLTKKLLLNTKMPLLSCRLAGY